MLLISVVSARATFFLTSPGLFSSYTQPENL